MPSELEDSVNKLFTTIFEFTRMRRSLKGHIMKLLKNMVESHVTLDYNYLLTKNCPLPHNWSNGLKQGLLAQAKLGPKERKATYNVLFENCTSSARDIADFL